MSAFGGKTYLLLDPEGNNRLPKNGGWAQDVRHG
jgi:hypothetical protein